MTTDDAVVRRASDGDLEGLFPLIRELYEMDHHDFDRDRIERGLEPLLRDDTHGQVWVLDSGGDLDGYAAVMWSWSLESGGRVCILDELYVRTRSRGRGSILLGAALAGARTAGAEVVFLETDPANERARSFYRREGFEPEDSLWMSRSLLG